MQLRRARQLRRAWRTSPCDHPAAEPELVGAYPTGDFVCTRCGAVLDRGAEDGPTLARAGKSGESGCAEQDGDAARAD